MQANFTKSCDLGCGGFAMYVRFLDEQQFKAIALILLLRVTVKQCHGFPSST
jgi:hypothetical protein